MAATMLLRRLGTERSTYAYLAAGSAAGCALIALADPSGGSPYPTCPTRSLLGLDCPVCGTLRGLHSLSRGRLVEALNHNVLLVLAVPIGALVWWRWVRAALGRPSRSLRIPAWVAPVLIGLGVAFAIVRNLPVSSLAWLDSAA